MKPTANILLQKVQIKEESNPIAGLGKDGHGGHRMRNNDVFQ